MSSPIVIRRLSSSSSSSSASSALASSAPTTPPSPGLYIPIHKRGSSSRASSPPLNASFSVNAPPKRPGEYSIEFLLSMSPNADESMKEKMRVSCPEVVMTRRARKSLEYVEQQSAVSRRKATQFHSQPQQFPITSPSSSALPAGPQRVNPRRNWPLGCAPEQKRQALQSTFYPSQQPAIII